MTTNNTTIWSISRHVADKLVLLGELQDNQKDAHWLVDLYLWHVLNLGILERFQDDITDDIVYYPFRTTSRPVIASTSNLT